MAASSPAAHLLVVDDHPMIRDLVVSFVEAAGMTAEAVDSGEAAIERYFAQPQRYALVLLDLSLPGLGGPAVLTRIKEHDPASRVLLMSGHDEGTMAMLAEDLGAAGYVCKPFTPDGLVKAVRRHMRR